MKNRIRSVVKRSSQNDRVYRAFWYPLIRLCALAQRDYRWRQLDGGSDPESAIEELAPEGTVMAGPFAGLHYPTRQATGSAYWPKIIGSYEAELHGTIQDLLHLPYDEVIDIGCAEGYYAVGLAMRFPRTRVFAYDTEPAARDLCRALAGANGVSDRITISGTCTASDLSQLPPARRFVVADCEGYERQLFTPEVCRHLADADLLIEVHDFLSPGLAQALHRVVLATHDVTRIASVTDFARPGVFDFAGLHGLAYETKARLMAEWRPLEMEWFVCRARRPADVSV